MTRYDFPDGEKVLVDKSGATGIIIFNDPARHNAMSRGMWEALHKALIEFEHDNEIKSVLLSGAGSKAFISGANISEFEKNRSSDQDVQIYEAITERTQLALYHFSKPTIAKIRGYCLGGGLGLALCCDIRIATEGSRFGIPAGRLGLGYRLSAMNALVQSAGVPAALDIFLSGRQFTAQQALSRNLIQYVVPGDQLDSTIDAYLDNLNSNAPMTLRLGKEMIRALSAVPESVGATAMAARVRECYQSYDYQEGKAAFKERRTPKFIGR